MNDNVLIYVCGKHVDYDDISETEINVRGNLEKTESGFVLSYIDHDLDAERSTVLTVDGDTLYMKERGFVNTDMRFCPGKSYVCDYVSEYFNFPIKIVTHYLKTEINEKGAYINIKYDTVFLSQQSTANSMEIKAEYSDKEIEDVLIS